MSCPQLTLPLTLEAAEPLEAAEVLPAHPVDTTPVPPLPLDRIERLRADIRAKERADRERRTLPVLPGLAALFPDDGLRRGASYAVEGSSALATALLAGASAAGSWIGVVGVPTFGAEAAAGFGVDLSRLVLVPTPGGQWFNVVGTLLDTFDLVVVRPPARATDGDVRRMAARLRERSAVLITLGSWPGARVRLRVSGSSWFGLEAGHGRLRSRQVTVSATGRGEAVRARSARLWLPDADGAIRPVVGEPVAGEPAVEGRDGEPPTNPEPLRLADRRHQPPERHWAPERHRAPERTSERGHRPHRRRPRQVARSRPVEPATDSAVGPG